VADPLASFAHARQGARPREAAASAYESPLPSLCIQLTPVDSAATGVYVFQERLSEGDHTPVLAKA